MRIFTLVRADLVFSVLFLIYLLLLMMLLGMEARICFESGGALSLCIIDRLVTGWSSAVHAHISTRTALVNIHVRGTTSVVRGGDWLQDVVLGVRGAWRT
jgi:hypothetical protein